MADSVVPFADLAALHRPLRSDLLAAAERVIDRGWFVLGEEVATFEGQWAQASGSDFAVGVGTGLDALTLSLEALGVGPGDEVVVPSNTYIATWLAVSAVGATPVPVEPDPITHVMTPAAAETAIGLRTAALLPVHLYGRPVDIDGFEKLATQHGVALVFDAAQAHGATFDSRPVGGRGDATAWSFYPTKNLGALGDGGAVTTNDPVVAQTVSELRDYGRESRHRFTRRGRNSRLDELQAAFLRVKLEHLENWVERRREIAARYCDGLDGIELTLPAMDLHASSAWHFFVVRSRQRDRLRSALTELGIETDVHYPIPPHRQPAYAELAPKFGSLPVSEQLAEEVLSLPMHPMLQDDAVFRVIAAVRSSI
jgi:dTDP-4-amino-4,6-dideoxygalactose transaminase